MEEPPQLKPWCRISPGQRATSGSNIVPLPPHCCHFDDSVLCGPCSLVISIEATASVAQNESWELGSDDVCHVTPTHISSDDPSPNVTKCGGALRRIGNSCAS